MSDHEPRIYQLILELPTGKQVSYPPKGHPYYTRSEVVHLLEVFRDRGYVGDMEPWAETIEAPGVPEHTPHRFTLDWLKEYPNWPEGEPFATGQRKKGTACKTTKAT